ncbi:hypothetical protein [Conexibacter sp. CPCC 206217]|uniref:nucleotide-binding protein n=1 Tax=Conexibacter sp. CPCC 206217 TaxID=3064574 RepID=UPI00271F2BBB|nr:hypothetical protein [Conexibacter sp. CPCC 206217]MDO8209856.1 hypothetical protein [Conexibacter sp. CPCC 206217]
MTPGDISRALRRFWPLSLGVLALFIALGAAAALLPTKKYTASALMFVQPTNIQSPNFSTGTLDLLLPTVVQQVSTRRFTDAVRGSSSRPLGDTSLTATAEPGTGVLKITAESTDPQAAAVAANVATAELRVNPISTAIRYSVLDPAVAPTAPSSPKRGPILVGCLVLGLIAAIFAALVADSLRKRVSGAEAVRQGFGLTVLGEITRSRRVRQQPRALFRDMKSREVAEEYQRLRTNFELLSGDVHTVAVTSWAQGEGKTTVVANLGWLLASMGRQVTIVDFDLRRPSVHMPFGLDVRDGVADVADIADGGARGSHTSVRPKATAQPGLEILTGGALTDQPARVIENAYPLIVETFPDRLLLIDTPPLQAAETALIASMVDALVIVIDVRRREPSELEALLQVLKLTQTRILGVVLNQVRGSSRQRQISDYYARPAQSQTPERPASW